jgi:hypothetical protein
MTLPMFLLKCLRRNAFAHVSVKMLMTKCLCPSLLCYRYNDVVVVTGKMTVATMAYGLLLQWCAVCCSSDSNPSDCISDNMPIFAAATEAELKALKTIAENGVHYFYPKHSGRRAANPRAAGFTP